MSVDNLPLLELFTRLRQAGMPLGVDNYRLLLHALQAGFGFPDKEALARLCQTLWVKSDDEARLFDYHFRQMMAQTAIEEDSSQTPESLSSQSNAIPSSFTPLPTQETASNTPPSAEFSLSPLKIEYEVQVAQAAQHAAIGDHDNLLGQFISTDEYFPVTRRQMKQSWRNLRRRVREGPATELDINATVEQIARQGILLEPVFVPRRVNQAELLLLIDQGGSMVPFHDLSRRLAETALQGGRLGKASIYYFHNCPSEYLYHDPAYEEHERIEDTLNYLHPQRTCVLVFSDGGAARGGLSPERINLTRELLDQLKQKYRYIAWLNPMPRSRWFGTTAGEIMRLATMFDISRRGLDDAVDVLRGLYRSIEAKI